MEGFDQGSVAPESPTGIDPSVATDPNSSAGTQNTEQQPGQVTDSRGNVIPPWRVQEMIQRASDRTASQLRQEFAVERQQMQDFFARQSQAQQQNLLQGLQQRANQPSRTPEEEYQRQRAQEALHELAPGLKAMPAMAQAVLQAQERANQQDAAIARLEETTARSFVTGEQGRLAQMVGSAGLGLSKQQQFAFENYVAGIIRSDPSAHAAFVSGDTTILPRAFEVARQEYMASQQAARASLAQTKTATRNLPPRMGGHAPGATPIPRFDPKDPRGSMAKIHAGAEADLMSRLG